MLKPLAQAVRDYFDDQITPLIERQITRERVFELERVMRTMPQVEVPVRHFFSHGVYAREMTLAKGTLITGKIHKRSQLNILSAGEVSVLIDGRMERLKAPYAFVAAAGAKRIIYAHEDCVYTTAHGTHERDLEKIEAHFIANDEAEFQAFLALENKKGDQQ